MHLVFPVALNGFRMGPALAAGFTLLLLVSQAAVGGQPVTYNHDVRPILSDKCFACHGPDEEDREAGLRLDIRDAAVESGVLDVGDAEMSPLMERIVSDDPEIMMPPPSARKR